MMFFPIRVFHTLPLKPFWQLQNASSSAKLQATSWQAKGQRWLQISDAFEPSLVAWQNKKPLSPKRRYLQKKQ